jgi:CRP-like cAMP-binding protein
MAGLLGAVVWGYSFYLPYLLLGVALFLHDLAYTRVALLRDQPESALGLSNERRLVRAFTWTADAVYRQLREIMGARQARLLAGRLNNYTLATGWRVFFVKDRMDGALPEDLSLIEQGKGYATILTLLLNLVAEAMGEKLTVRVLQRAYDSLPWEEREVGAQYLFPHVARAEALSRAFQDTRQNYRGLLRQMPLFSAMDDAEINLLCARLQAREYEPGQAIVRQGEAGEHFYIVAWGAVEVEMRDARGVAAVTGQLDRGDCFGEAALLQDTRHTATYRAAMPTSVLALSREDFERLVKARVIEREKVGRSVAWADLLRQMPLFAELDGRQIGRIAAQVQAATFAPGALLIRQGEVGDAFYVIESGRAQVSVEREGEMRAVAELGPGEYVGEIALLLQVPRTATVQALTPLNTLVLRKNDFDRLVASHLYVSQGLERESSRRMMDLR